MPLEAVEGSRKRSREESQIFWEEILHARSRTESQKTQDILQHGVLSLEEEEEERKKETGTARLFPESPERSDRPGTIFPREARTEPRRFVRRAAALRENLLRRHRKKHALRAITQKELHVKEKT